MTHRAYLATILLLSVTAPLQGQTASAPPPRTPLRIVSAGPTGEVASIEEANEIRLVFSEPMVAMGRVPTSLRPEYFHLTPATSGTFRWSGTTILIFTPARRWPLATKYDVTIDPTATAVSGRKLDEPYAFTFTTPTVRLLQTRWYRPEGRYDRAPIVLLRWNQPVKPEDVAAHVTAHFQDHAFTAPVLDQAVQPRLRSTDPAGLEAFDAKVRSARAAASSTSPVAMTLAAEWDKKKFPPARDLVVFEITTPVPPDSWVKLEIDGRIPSPAGPALSQHTQNHTIQVEPTFFIDGFHCRTACEPELSNDIEIRVPVKTEAFAAATNAVDITDPQRERAMTKSTPKKRETWQRDESRLLSLEDAGLQAQPPSSTWVATISSDLHSSDDQTLGYTWAGVVENWHQRAFTSFGDGHGVWETGGGALLPFYSRNFLNVRQWAVPLQPGQLMQTVQDLRASNFHTAPSGTAVERKLGVSPDKIQSHGLDLSKALKPSGTGLVWTAVEEGQPIERAHVWRDNAEPAIRASLVQVTNLGISVKDSPLNTLIFVTRLDNAAPVAGARVSIVKPDGKTMWSGTTAADGVVVAPETRLRNPRRWWEFAFLVLAEKDGDVAYAASDWNDGVRPWDFLVPFNLDESEPLLRGSVFSDRGVYRLGEEVHLKAVLRHNTPEGIKLLAAGTDVILTIRDSRNRIVDERTVKMNGWSSGEWAFTLPSDGALGNYQVRAVLASDRPKPGPKQTTPAAGDEEVAQDEDGVSWNKSVNGSFLVAAYRKPDFRVDVSLNGTTLVAGNALKGVVTARYLFGAPMVKRPTHWAFTRAQLFTAPATILTKYPADRWTFVGWANNEQHPKTEMASDDGQLAANGQLPLTLQTDSKAGMPFSYTLEGDVEDVSRQHIANRASVVVHPAPWYIGIKRVPYFTQQQSGLATELVAVGLDGAPVAGVAINVTLTQIQWQSVRRAEGNGFYSWETQRKEVPSGEWHLTSAVDPVPLNVPLPAGGFFILEARANADGERYTVTRSSFYALGPGYTAWQRYDHNRIDLVAERSTYKPGETARIMIQSPWEQATALVTTEREGIRSHRQFTLTSTQQSIDIPITENDIPNLFVSVLLVKGRSKPAGETIKESDPADPGKPSFRLGYVQLAVEDASKRLMVGVSANKEEYRPANSANVTVDVKDRQGRGSASEVTLWAVDYGVLSLTAYRTPDVLGSVYVPKALEVLNEDTRQRIVSRRVLTPKGASDGGGGGLDAGPGTVRRDFRTLAFWLGSVTTDARGHASVDVKLPESLTTYRIMAVAADRSSRFGNADTEIRVNKPVTLKAAFPRFLAVGDKATFGAVVTSQLKTDGAATLTIGSLDPEVMEFIDTTPHTIDVPAGGSVEVRFDAAGRAIGRARVRVTVKLAGEEDAFEDVIPVEVLVSPETVSAIGEAEDGKPLATERLKLPTGVVPSFGGLRVELASTALVGLGEGARYLVEYPYGCAEQRGSRALALLLAADLGDAFKLPGIEPDHLRATVQSALKDLERYQCDGGGFAYWPGACWSTSPYLTAYLLHVFKVASDLHYDVNAGMRERAYTYLQRELAEPPPTNESWWPSYTAWQAFAVKVLVEGGRNQDSNITRLYGYRERMPVFGLAYLHDALVAKGEASGPRAEELRRRMSNAILPEGASAHVEELSDPYLLWFWNSNVRSTAIVLNTLVKANQADTPYRQLVQWMLQARNKGRWGNTQENAIALEALVSYYRRFEATVPDFTAVVALSGQQLAREQFNGRTTDSRSTDVPMPKLLASAQPGAEQPLTFTRTGQGTLFYSARVRYAADRLFQQGLDQGIRIDRTYAPYVETGTGGGTKMFKEGGPLSVTPPLQLTKERRFVAVTDPLPAGFEPVESWFATSAASLAKRQDEQPDIGGSWFSWWQRGGFDHVERYDDRVELFATRLSEGRHQFTYVVRATTAGTFRTAPAHAEEMYEPEVFGRTATAIVDVKK
jgi:alpha-2-macroglobulin